VEQPAVATHDAHEVIAEHTLLAERVLDNTRGFALQAPGACDSAYAGFETSFAPAFVGYPRCTVIDQDQ